MGGIRRISIHPATTAMTVSLLRLLLTASLCAGFVSCISDSAQRSMNDDSWSNSSEEAVTPHGQAAENAYQTGYAVGRGDRQHGLSRYPARHALEASSSMRYYWNHGYTDGWNGAPKR